MNVKHYNTMEYGEKDTWSSGKNEPKTNPNEPNFKTAKMNVTSIITKAYENMSNWTICENEPKTNPIYPGVASGEDGIYHGVASVEAGSYRGVASGEDGSKAKNMSGPPKYLTFTYMNANLKSRLAFSLLKERTLFRR